LQQHWENYCSGVATLEQHHVDIYLHGADDIKQKIQSLGVKADCDTLDKQIKTIWSNEQARIDGLQQTFHAEENARLAAEREPIQNQIDTDRSKLDDLQGQVDALDAEAAQLVKDISALRDQEDSLDAQIDQILDAFPGTKPETVRERLQSLVQQSNDLLSQDNAKVDQHNDALTQRASLAAQHDALVETTNNLVESYNWTR
jgi:chromosome segregation ATPase